MNRSPRAWALETKPTTFHDRFIEELTAAEREVLREGGLDLSRSPDTDPFTAPVAAFAAIVATSLDTRGVAERLGVQVRQVRRMIAGRTLFSVRLGERRHVPSFQFRRSGPLVTNIAQVNPALPIDLHPVSVHGWYTCADVDLLLDGDGEGAGLTPLEWLDSGGDPGVLVSIARRL